MINGATALTNIHSVVAGDSFSCALDNNGQVWCWGIGASGEHGVGTVGVSPINTAQQTNATSATKLTAGKNSICARQNTSLLCWGSNSGGMLGLPENNPTNTSTPTVLPDFLFLF